MGTRLDRRWQSTVSLWRLQLLRRTGSLEVLLLP
jgi:hypothetical protein